MFLVQVGLSLGGVPPGQDLSHGSVGVGVVWFENLRVWSLLYLDDVVLGVFRSGPSELGYLNHGRIQRDCICSLVWDS